MSWLPLTKALRQDGVTYGVNRYREAAICEARYPYMRDENDSMDFDPNRDFFRCPRLDEKNVNAHLEVYSMKHDY